MTREEQIEQAWLGRAIQSYHRYDEKSFKEGAKWADETIIEKACWWLRETAHFYVSDFTGELDDNGLIEDFRKAMEK